MRTSFLLTAALSAAMTIVLAAPANATTPPVAPTLTRATLTGASNVTAAPSFKSVSNDSSAKSARLTEALLAIAPSSNTCASASFPSECRTASQAAPAIAASFSKYEISGTTAQAALIALMAYESGEFKYAINHWPGVKGQGCRNMQSPTFNNAFAAHAGVTVDQVQVQDATSFAAAAWFITTECQPSVSQALEVAGAGQAADAAWQDYMHCVGATGDLYERGQYFQKAVQALAK